MCLQIAEAKTQLEVLASQVQFITTQEKSGIEARHLKIRCVCLKLVSWAYMHRCLYCSVFYCRECAEQHFGKTIQQYRAENPVEQIPGFEDTGRKENL